MSATKVLLRKVSQAGNGSYHPLRRSPPHLLLLRESRSHCDCGAVLKLRSSEPVPSEVMWGLLPIFIAKLVAGIVAWKKNYEATPVGIQFVSRLVGDCILVVFTLLLIQIYLLYVFLSAHVVFFSV